MEFDLKKPFIILCVLLGLGWYVRTRYTLQDALSLSKRYPSPSVSPAVDYYVGMAYYLRDRYEPAAGAFNQLLADYPTSYYAPAGAMRLGDSYEKLMNWQGAKETYELYLERFPEDGRRSLVQKKYEQVKFKN